MDDERPLSDIALHADEMMATLKELLAQYQTDGTVIDKNNGKSQCSAMNDTQSSVHLNEAK